MTTKSTLVEVPRMPRYYELYRDNAIIKTLVDNYIERHNVEIWIDCKNPFVNLDLGMIIKHILRRG